MLVRLKNTFAGPDGRTGQAGEVIDLPDDQARMFIDAGTAEEAPAETAQAVAPGTLTQAGSFGGTPASPATSGQTPGIGSGAPDPLVGHVPAIPRTPEPAAAPATKPEPEPVVNQEALSVVAGAPEEKGKKKG